MDGKYLVGSDTCALIDRRDSPIGTHYLRIAKINHLLNSAVFFFCRGVMPLCNQVGQSRLAETSGVLGFGETEKPLCQALRLDKPTVVFEQVVSCFPCAGVSAILFPTVS